ncbi:S8 family serine peptidase [Nonomuraea sp. NPDC046802]|uniref:S8 family serine peptidase n=1 Tax=Nonomuraea sp. NPDC046802 TaxID=3154919 RepID=UPI0033F434D3
MVPAVAYDVLGRPAKASNFGHSIGRSGVGAPGERITNLAADGDLHLFGGTSAAAAFVSGAMALLWSESPRATAASIRRAVIHSTTRRSSVVPPLLNAWKAYRNLAETGLTR